MAGRPPITPDQRQQIISLCQQGWSRNGICRELGLSGHIVSKVAAENGHSFVSRRSTVNATKARKIDLAAKRAEVAQAMIQKAAELLAMTDQPFLAFSFGGRDNTYNEHELDRPPTGDIRNLVQAASTLASRHLDLVNHDLDDADTERSLLSELGRRLGVTGPDA